MCGDPRLVRGAFDCGEGPQDASRHVVLRFCIVHADGTAFMCVCMHFHASSSHGVIDSGRTWSYRSELGLGRGRLSLNCKMRCDMGPSSWESTSVLSVLTHDTAPSTASSTEPNLMSLAMHLPA
jgi:hypothetical protein